MSDLALLVYVRLDVGPIRTCIRRPSAFEADPVPAPLPLQEIERLGRELKHAQHRALQPYGSSPHSSSSVMLKSAMSYVRAFVPFRVPRRVCGSVAHTPSSSQHSVIQSHAPFDGIILMSVNISEG